MLRWATDQILPLRWYTSVQLNFFSYFAYYQQLLSIWVNNKFQISQISKQWKDLTQIHRRCLCQNMDSNPPLVYLNTRSSFTCSIPQASIKTSLSAKKVICTHEQGELRQSSTTYCFDCPPTPSSVWKLSVKASSGGRKEENWQLVLTSGNLTTVSPDKSTKLSTGMF